MKPHMIVCLALSTAALAAAPAWAQTQQTTTIVRPDGSKVVIIHRGGEFGDGFYDANHNWVRVDANGKVIVEHPNGSETVTHPDGTRVHTNAAGDRTVQTNPDGSRVITEREQ
jgi:YD repeat-containing protein